MIIKTVQWNIGGGKFLTEGADPSLLKSYREDGLPKIIEILHAINPDIITLQETHASDGHSQPEEIAKALGYEGWINDEWADSHVEEGQRLGQGIVSRYPIIQHDSSGLIIQILKLFGKTARLLSPTTRGEPGVLFK